MHCDVECIIFDTSNNNNLSPRYHGQSKKMTTHTPLTCSACIAGVYRSHKDIESMTCNITGRCTVVAHIDVESVDDYPVPVDCPLHTEDFLLTLNTQEDATL